MSKNRKWSYKLKVEICKRLISGESYSYLAKEYNVKSTGMLANWKKAYLDGTLTKNRKQGRQKCEVGDVEILKKCFAQLMKIRSK